MRAVQDLLAMALAERRREALRRPRRQITDAPTAVISGQCSHMCAQWRRLGLGMDALHGLCSKNNHANTKTHYRVQLQLGAVKLVL